MTTYASNWPYTEQGAERFHVWGDTEAEAQMSLMMLGLDPATRRGTATQWRNYWVTLTEIHALAALGVRITDRLGPAEHWATVTGNVEHMAWIAKARLRGCV